MAEEPQYHHVVGKPLFDILSKLPTKSLLRFRCVSKLWRQYIDDSYFVSVYDKQVIKDPTPIIFSLTPDWNLPKTPFFHAMESDTLSNNVLKSKSKVGLLEFVGKKLLNKTSRIVGSCNGLVIIETDHKPTSTFTVIHPINKQCYVLPQLSNSMLNPGNRESCGLGFDSSTNTFKMVCVYNYPKITTMVHVFGTNSWHTIPQVPSYHISGNAIFAHGCLYWLTGDHNKQVIWFDVENEEFGLIKPPQRNMNCELVNLAGQLGYFGDFRTVWLLNDKKEWMLHCAFKGNEFDPEDGGFINVVGCLNKDGDILFKSIHWLRGVESIYIYNLKNRVMHDAGVDGLDLKYGCKTKIVMFPNSLSDITRNSNLLKKKRLKKRKHEAFLADQNRI